MKKIYTFLSILFFAITAFGQGAVFVIDFEGSNPLSNLPTGVTIVDAFGTDVNVRDLGSVSQVANVVSAGGTGTNTLKMDRQSHIILGEDALGNGSFSIVAKYEGSGNGDNSVTPAIGNVQGMGFMSVVYFGAETSPSAWQIRRLEHRFANGQMNGLQMNTTTNAFGSRLPVRDDLLEGMKHVVLTYNDTDGLFRLYIEGQQAAISGSNDVRLTGNTDVNVYLSYRSGAIDTSTGAVTPSFNGSGETKDVKSEWDDISVFQRALSDQDVTDLFNGADPLTLSVQDPDNILSVSVHPNPVTDYLNFTGDSVTSIEVYDILGTKVFSRVLDANQTVDVSNLAAGLYLVKCSDNDAVNSTVFKIVKK